MNRRGLKWAVTGTVGLALVVLGAYLAWERHRYRVETPRGVVRIGMPSDEVEAMFGARPAVEGRHGWIVFLLPDDLRVQVWCLDGRVAKVTFPQHDGTPGEIPRPSLIEHIRSWFTGKAE